MPLFLSHLNQQLKLEELADDRALVRGMPLLKTGTWNSTRIGSADLASAVQNFAALAADHGWLPGGWPSHPPAEGPRARNALDRLAIVQNLYTDPSQQQLNADVMLLGKEAIDAFKAGRLPYVSSEVEWQYQVTGGGQRLPGMTFTGFAWVDDPAVKGLPAATFANAADHSELWPSPAGRPAHNPDKENRPAMTFKERLLALFAKSKDTLTPEEASATEAAIAALPDGVAPPAPGPSTSLANTPAPAAPAPTSAPAPAAPAQPDPVLAALQKTVDDQNARILQLTRSNRETANRATVDGLVASGQLPPASAPLLAAVLNNLPTDGPKVVYLAKGTDGQEASTEVDLPAAVLQLANAGNYKALFEVRGTTDLSREATSAASLPEKELDALASSVRRVPAEDAKGS